VVANRDNNAPLPPSVPIVNGKEDANLNLKEAQSHLESFDNRIQDNFLKSNHLTQGVFGVGGLQTKKETIVIPPA
jgi:hypothetical protein